MGTISGVKQVPIGALTPYERNAKLHSPEQVRKIADSIREFGFISPCLIDREGNVIAGHGRILAAQELGMTEVPCVYVEGLTEAQRRAYVLADNRLTELGEWDDSLVQIELRELADLDFDIDLTGFELKGDWFADRERDDTSRQEGNDEYNDFLDKFEPKKTTDDCYTPDGVYDAVADWVAQEYHLSREKFVRPFYPGGDYQNETYAADAVVVDNPPFSIMTEILHFYVEHSIRFFLFAPTLTLFTSSDLRITYIPTKCAVTYENGAKVNTSFITNLDTCRLRTAVKLSDALEKVDKERNGGNDLPKYEYPSHVVTAPRAGRWTENGVDVRIEFNECQRIAALDSQKEQGKAIYGGGLLVSDAVAQRADEADKGADRRIAERAAERLRDMAAGVKQNEDGAIVWELSEREREIIRKLGEGEADV